MDNLPGPADASNDPPGEVYEVPAEVEPFDLPEPGESEEYELVLLNDDTHTFEYVMGLMRDVFGVPWDKGFAVAETIDYRGKRVVFTGTWREVAQKRDEVIAYGPDARLPYSSGPLKAEIRPSSRG